jgi:hypothetical protein
MSQTIPEPVERALRHWGSVFGRPLDYDAPPEEAEPAGATSIAHVAVDRSREADVREDRRPRTSANRAAVARRLIQRTLGETVRVPTWAGGDPIRCVESTRFGAPWNPDPEAERVEMAVLALGRWDRRAMLALRACYCLLGRRPLSERIEWVEKAGGTRCSRMNYRAALARGRVQLMRALYPLEKTG